MLGNVVRKPLSQIFCEFSGEKKVATEDDYTGSGGCRGLTGWYAAVHCVQMLCTKGSCMDRKRTQDYTGSGGLRVGGQGAAVCLEGNGEQLEAGGWRGLTCA